MQTHPLRTQKGYDFFEASSAFQKAVRRGDERRALFFAAEFYLSGYDEYIWKRMRVIVSEDIGLAEPHLPATVQALYEAYRDMRKKTKQGGKPSERLMLVQSVLLLCRARKSRLVCHASIAVFRRHAGEQPGLLDHDLDVHTARGRRMGRGYAHFFDEAAHLENREEVDGDAAYRDDAWEALRDEHPEREGPRGEAEPPADGGGE